MFARRIIPRPDVNAGRVVKRTNIVHLHDASDPAAQIGKMAHHAS